MAIIHANEVGTDRLLGRATPNCPIDCSSIVCKSDEVCTIGIPTDGNCPKPRCQKSSEVTLPSSSTPSSSAGTNIPAIVGGVVGAVVVMAIIAFMVWRFCVKTKRPEYEQKPWGAPGMLDDEDAASAEKDFGAAGAMSRQRSQRAASVHTSRSRNSIASTVLTRASNIIQIAYIPGVTNRPPPTPSDVLVPPVPPIPLQHANSPNPYEEQHFFVPDIRDSTYSGMSGMTDRTSMAGGGGGLMGRRSYAPRASIASTVYGGKSAVVSQATIAGAMLKPAVVSVRSTGSSNGGSNTNSILTPPMPSIDRDRWGGGATGGRPASPANSTFSVGSTFLQNASASTATAAKPQVVRIGSVRAPNGVNGKRGAHGASGSHASMGSSGRSSVGTVPSQRSTLGTPVRVSAVRDSQATGTVIEDSPSVDQGPFADPLPPPPSLAGAAAGSPAEERAALAVSTTSLSAVIEEATKRAARGENKTSSAERGESPFSDANETKETK